MLGWTVLQSLHIPPPELCSHINGQQLLVADLRHIELFVAYPFCRLVMDNNQLAVFGAEDVELNPICTCLNPALKR